MCFKAYDSLWPTRLRRRQSCPSVLSRCRCDDRSRLFEPMGLLRMSGSNGNGAEEAEAHARLAHCMVARRAADAKPCWHIPHGPPCCHAVLCCSHAAVHQTQGCTCSLIHSTSSSGWCLPTCGGGGGGRGGQGNRGVVERGYAAAMQLSTKLRAAA